MGAISSLIIIVAFSVLFTRIATILLRHTGMSREMARFQARSAFTGAGFTTNESENVVNHPVRRRIVFTLMLLGNAGIVSTVASLLLAFMDIDEGSAGWGRLLLLLVGVSLIWLAARSQWLDAQLSRFVARLVRRHPRLLSQDFENLLQLGKGYRVQEMTIANDDWLVNRNLKESNLSDEGVLVLGLVREDKDYVGTPSGSTLIQDGDRLICYGPQEVLDELAERRRGRRGDQAHSQAAEAHEQRQRQERREEVQHRIERERRRRLHARAQEQA